MSYEVTYKAGHCQSMETIKEAAKVAWDMVNKNLPEVVVHLVDQGRAIPVLPVETESEIVNKIFDAAQTKGIS